MNSQIDSFFESEFTRRLHDEKTKVVDVKPITLRLSLAYAKRLRGQAKRSGFSESLYLRHLVETAIDILAPLDEPQKGRGKNLVLVDADRLEKIESKLQQVEALFKACNDQNALESAEVQENAEGSPKGEQGGGNECMRDDSDHFSGNKEHIFILGDSGDPTTDDLERGGKEQPYNSKDSKIILGPHDMVPTDGFSLIQDQVAASWKGGIQAENVDESITSGEPKGMLYMSDVEAMKNVTGLSQGDVKTAIPSDSMLESVERMSISASSDRNQAEEEARDSLIRSEEVPVSESEPGIENTVAPEAENGIFRKETASGVRVRRRTSKGGSLGSAGQQVRCEGDAIGLCGSDSTADDGVPSDQPRKASSLGNASGVGRRIVSICSKKNWERRDRHAQLNAFSRARKK